MTTIGLINPGQMGASVGAAAANNNDVFWVSAGRSKATKDRAQNAGIKDCASLQELVHMSDVILSICPPHAALDVASEVSSRNFQGVYLDANAIAPGKVREMGKMIAEGGATFVDGGIIGGPVSEASGTTLHLAGENARQIAALFEGSPLKTNIVSNEIGAASALKMVFAAFSKGSTALLTAILAVAETEGVRADLEKQWGTEFSRQTTKRVTVNTAKAWRFVGEMEEIAATFESAGLSNGFHKAAADTYTRLAEFKDEPTPDLTLVLKALMRDQES